MKKRHPVPFVLLMCLLEKICFGLCFVEIHRRIPIDGAVLLNTVKFIATIFLADAFYGRIVLLAGFMFFKNSRMWEASIWGAAVYFFTTPINLAIEFLILGDRVKFLFAGNHIVDTIAFGQIVASSIFSLFFLI